VDELFNNVFGAFFGALSAFLLGWFLESRKDKHKRNAALNEYIQMFLINIEALITFKMQFLHLFSQELDEVCNHAGQYYDKISEKELKELQADWNKKHFPQLDMLLKNNEKDSLGAGLNGLFKRKWQPVRIVMPSIEKIYFVAVELPDTIRLASLGISSCEAFLEALKHRDSVWCEAEPSLTSNMLEPVPHFMRSLYELIDIRQTLSSHVDDAVIFMQATIYCLEKYQDKFFPERCWILEKLFGKYMKIRHSYPLQFNEYLPLPEHYASALGQSWELLKPYWNR
jgi:hypothetical protein